VRYGFEKKFNPEWKAGFALSVSDAQTNGTQTDPTSANTTFNNDFSYKNIWIDKAYASYSPDWAKWGPISSFTITAGKTDNPFERGSKELVWKMDNVRPEGIYETADFNLYQGDNITLKGYGVLGQFVLRVEDTDPETVREEYFYALQEDLLWLEDWSSPFELEVELKAWIERYNNDYPHSTLHYQTPVEFEKEQILLTTKNTP